MIKTKDGIELFTQSWKVENPKAIIVLTHGFDDHSSRYAHVGKALNEAGYSLYAYDWRGQGKSGGTRGHTPSYNQLLDDLSLVIADAKKDQPNKKLFLYGHSMGGNITLNYALRRADGITGVMVSGSQLRLAFQPSAFQVALGRGMANLIPSFSQKVNLDINTISRDQAVRDAYRADPLRSGVISAKLFVESMNASDYAFAHAVEIKLPVLLLHGGSDGLIDPKGSEEFVQRVGIPDKKFKRYEGLYHEIHNEPEKQIVFNDMIEWLNQH
ncbi:MAG: lysophospholipase [Chloroflexi bacterium]|nr:lysophospholipase [Chloroflexota bacterium]